MKNNDKIKGIVTDKGDEYTDKLFENRLKQFDAQRWKTVTLMNCLSKSKPAIYYVIDGQKEEQKKESNNIPQQIMVYMYDDKEEYLKHKKRVGDREHKNVEFTYEDKPIEINDQLSINLIPPDIYLNNKKMDLG